MPSCWFSWSFCRSSDCFFLSACNFFHINLHHRHFPQFLARPNKSSSPRLRRLAPHGSITSLKIFFKVIACSSWISYMNSCTTAAKVSSFIRRSDSPANFSCECSNKFPWTSPISLGGITSSKSSNPLNNGRCKEVPIVRTRSLDSWKHVGGSGVTNKTMFGCCNLPLQKGFIRHFRQLRTQISPCSVIFCVVKSASADVISYVESNKSKS